jgi:hypothetical protein
MNREYYLAGLAVLAVLSVAVQSAGGMGASRAVLEQTSPAAEALALAQEEKEGSGYAQMAKKFRAAARVASDEEKDAHRAGPVDTLRVASEKLDLARGHLHSASDGAALERLASSLKAYSQALIRNKDGLEFEAPAAYTHLSSFELQHPGLARIRKSLVHPSILWHVLML